MPKELVEIISRILRGRASSLENKEFNEWYDQGLNSPLKIHDYKKRDKDQIGKEIFEKTLKKIHSDLPHSKDAKVSFLSWKVAASIILLIGLGFLFIQVNEWNKPIDHQENRMLVFENGVGMFKKVRLPDGSTVRLNHRSKITVAENFQENRWVELEGEAFFEVQRDTLHPFRIKTQELVTEVLGTSFLIRNQPDQPKIVAVKTGLVKVQDEKKQVFMLEATKGLTYQKGEGSLSTINADASLFGWIEERLVFDQTNMKTMVQVLEEWYGVSIQHNITDTLTCKISGTYKEQSLENLLKIIQYSIPLSYKIDGKNLILNFNNCQ